MDNLSFYNVPSDYVKYLHAFEENARGFSHIPYVDYAAQNRKDKFFCGVVLRINDMQYCVPVSSQTRSHPNTFYLYFNRQRIASLRFDYMFPVPPSILSVKIIQSEPDPKYQRLLALELEICRQNRDMIRSFAFHAYLTVCALSQANQLGRQNHSCDFLLLEGACRQYCREQGLDLSLPISSQLAAAVEPARKPTLTELCADAQQKAAEINAGKAAEIDPVQHELNQMD